MKKFCLSIALLTALGAYSPAQSQNETAKPEAERITNGPVVEGVGETWATIAWTTNTGGSSVIHYGTDKNSLNQTAESPYANDEKSVHQTHRVQIKGLKPNTNYFYQVLSGQGKGTGTEAKSSVAQFTTKGSEAAKPEAERITNGPVVEGTGETWANIAWTTNTGGSSVIHYGTDKNSLNQTAESPYADDEKSAEQTHRVQVKNLNPGTTYYFQVVSGQGEGTGTEAKSSVAQFTTRGKR